MLATSRSDVRSGGLDQDVHLPATVKLRLIEFIAAELPRWRDHPDRPPAQQAETKLTEHLCDHLNGATHQSAAWSHVQFRTEVGDEIQGGRTIDLAAKPCGVAIVIEGRRHSQFDQLFPIECKRLPTPREKGRDEREYVTTAPGTTGGVQRFKFGYHGASHSFAAMIAYVQENSFAEWLSRVNAWIRSLALEQDSAWTESDCLSELSRDAGEGVCVLYSHHERVGKLTELEVRHLWVKMN